MNFMRKKAKILVLFTFLSIFLLTSFTGCGGALVMTESYNPKTGYVYMGAKLPYSDAHGVQIYIKNIKTGDKAHFSFRRDGVSPVKIDPGPCRLESIQYRNAVIRLNTKNIMFNVPEGKVLYIGDFTITGISSNAGYNRVRVSVRLNKVEDKFAETTEKLKKLKYNAFEKIEFVSVFKNSKKKV